MAINLRYPGRMLSGNKRGPKGHICVWNANLCTKGKGKIWFGDVDVTADEENLKRIAKEVGEEVYVLREHDARFQNEASPRLERAVAIIGPDGSVQIAGDAPVE